MYHHLDEHPNTSGAITPSQFEAQPQLLDEKGNRSITPDQLLTAYDTGSGFSHPKCSLPFDDGYRSAHTPALPLLEPYGFEATVFIYTDRIIQLPGYLSTDGLRNMLQSGPSGPLPSVTQNWPSHVP